jgi:hypothetical protein
VFSRRARVALIRFPCSCDEKSPVCPRAGGGGGFDVKINEKYQGLVVALAMMAVVFGIAAIIKLLFS